MTGREGRRRLTVEEEMLLGRFCDEECGLLGRMKAKRLCRRSEEARVYVNVVGRFKEEICSCVCVLEASAELWERVWARIEYEERVGKAPPE